MVSFRNWIPAGFAACLMAIAPAAVAQKMFKCSDGAGGTVFQQAPCPETAKEAEAREQEKQRRDAEAAKKKEEDARKKAEDLQKVKERDAAYQKQMEERAELLKKQQEAEKAHMQGTSRDAATADGTLPAEVEQIYPAPWRMDANAAIAEVFTKNSRTCAKSRYRQRAGGISEFLVQCTSDGLNWVSYFAWPPSGTLKGPAKF